MYDEQGLGGIKTGRGGMPDDAEFADLLNHMFGAGAAGFGGGMGMGGMGGGEKRTRDTVKEFEVSLEDLYKGKQVKMISKRKIVCPSCKGYRSPLWSGLIVRSGGKNGAKPKKCPSCSGTGQKVVVDMFNHSRQISCSDCHGSGSIIHVKDRCKKCKGERLIIEKKPLEFWIERGMDEGDRIVLEGEADQEPGKETGDVIFVITEKDHPVFTRMGPDLRATLHITLQEALCGFSKVILTTLDGRGLSYTHKVTKGQIIRPIDVFKIAGEGMPVGKKSDAKGNLYLDVDIEFPADGWMTDPTKMNTLRSLLSTPSTRETNGTAATGVPEIVDDVTMERADPQEWEKANGWETESEGESDGIPEQCATQ